MNATLGGQIYKMVHANHTPIPLVVFEILGPKGHIPSSKKDHFLHINFPPKSRLLHELWVEPRGSILTSAGHLRGFPRVNLGIEHAGDAKLTLERTSDMTPRGQCTVFSARLHSPGYDAPKNTKNLKKPKNPKKLKKLK